jgi:hypothetical protein
MEKNMNNSLSEYQQGNRDGLISLAAELDLKIIELDESIATRTANRDKWSLHQAKALESLLLSLCTVRAQTIYIRDLARTRSEALPENPNAS